MSEDRVGDSSSYKEKEEMENPEKKIKKKTAWR